MRNPRISGCSLLGLALGLGLLFAVPTAVRADDDDDDDDRRHPWRQWRHDHDDDDDDDDRWRRGPWVYRHHDDDDDDDDRWKRWRHGYVHPHVHFGRPNVHVATPRTSRFGFQFSVGNRHYVQRPYIPSAPFGVVPTAPPTVLAPPPVRQHVAFNPRHEQLGDRMRLAANAICLELHYNYRENADFPQVYRQAYLLLTTAQAIQAAAQSGDQTTVFNGAQSAENNLRLFQQQIQSLLQTGNFRVGVDGLAEKIAALDAATRELGAVLGLRQQPIPPTQAVPIDPRQPPPPPPPSIPLGG